MLSNHRLGKYHLVSIMPEVPRHHSFSTSLLAALADVALGSTQSNMIRQWYAREPGCHCSFSGEIARKKMMMVFIKACEFETTDCCGMSCVFCCATMGLSAYAGNML
jgi:hypothetical protein